MDFPTAYLDLETEPTSSEVDLNRDGTDAYARACRVVVGAVAVDDGPAANFRTQDELVAILNDTGKGGQLHFRLVCHSILFEQAVLRECMPVALACVPAGGWRCTMVAARSLNLPGGLEDVHRALFPDMAGKTEAGKVEVRRATGDLFTGEEDRLRILADRCRDDVEKTRRVWKAIGPMLCPVDRALMPVDLRINVRGVPVDRELCVDKQAEVVKRRDELEREVAEKGWSAALSGTGGYRLASERKVKALAAQLPKQDSTELFQLAHMDGQLASAGHKWAAGEHYTHAGRARNTLVARFTQSGRWVGKKLQLQNMKRPDEEPLLDTRTMVKAPPGYSVVAADFKTMELRLSLWLSRAEEQLAALAEGRDLYTEMARSALGRDPEPHERFAMKSVLLGLQYGLSRNTAYRRMEEMGALPDTCAKVWKRIEEDLLPLYRGAWERLMSKLRENTGTHASHPVFAKATWLRLPLYQRHLVWHNVRWGDDPTYDTWEGRWVQKRLWHGVAYAHVVSGTAADIMAATLIKAEAEFEGTETSVVGHVHDEVICLTPKGTEGRVAELLKGWMRAAGKECPMDAEVGFGDTWRDAK